MSLSLLVWLHNSKQRGQTGQESPVSLSCPVCPRCFLLLTNSILPRVYLFDQCSFFYSRIPPVMMTLRKRQVGLSYLLKVCYSPFLNMSKSRTQIFNFQVVVSWQRSPSQFALTTSLSYKHPVLERRSRYYSWHTLRQRFYRKETSLILEFTHRWDWN